MAPTVRDLILVLDMFFPRWLPMAHALRILANTRLMLPLLQLHRRQRQDRRQPQQTGWLIAILTALKSMFLAVDNLPAEHDDLIENAEALHWDLEAVFELMGWDQNGGDGGSAQGLYPEAHITLCTQERACIICAQAGQDRSLRRRVDARTIRILTTNLQWVTGDIFVGHCIACKADHYPDKVTYRVNGGERRERLLVNAQYLRISKQGIWVDRRLAVMQERMLLRFHAGWSNFADYVNDMLPDGATHITNQQSRCLFLEHFARRLLTVHHCQDTFSCPAHPSAETFAEHLRQEIGENGGVIISSLHHGCKECTHRKRYREDLVAEGAIFENAEEIAGLQPVC